MSERSPDFFPIPESWMGGAIAVNVFAILCTLALVSVALRVIWLAIRSIFNKDSAKPQVILFFQTQLGNYAACLLVGMTLNCVAGMMALPWLIDRGITRGPACTAQAFLIQASTWSSAYFTVTIGIHTFNSLVLKRKQSLLLSRSTIAVGWTISALMASLPFFLPKPRTHGDIYGPDGLMCAFQRTSDPQYRFFLHLLPVLIASILSALLYSVIFLVLRGTLRIKGGIKLILDPNARWHDTNGDNYHRFIARIAGSMIWYPVAYVALLVPYSVVGLLAISGFNVPFQVVAFANTCWFTLGVVNVFLFYNTFRVLGPAFDSQSRVSTRKDLESQNPPNGLDNIYSTSFLGEKRAPVQEKPRQYHLPMPRFSSLESLSSEKGLLSGHQRHDSKQSNFSFSNTSDSERLLPSPKRTMIKGEALTHSRQSSITDWADQYRQIRSATAVGSPLVDIRSSPPGPQQRSLLPNEPLSRSESSSSANSSGQSRYPSPFLNASNLSPPAPTATSTFQPAQRQFTLSSSRSAGSLRPSNVIDAQEGVPKPLLMSSAFTSPRIAPRPY